MYHKNSGVVIKDSNATTGVKIVHKQFVYGLGLAQTTETALTPDLTLPVMGVIEGQKPFGKPPADASEWHKTPSAYGFRRISLRISTESQDHVVLTRQLLSDEDDDRNNKPIFQEHYVVLSLEEFRKVESNFGNLIGQWVLHERIPMWRRLKKIELESVQNVRTRPSEDRLTELRDRFTNDGERLKALLSLVLEEKPCTVAGFPHDEKKRLDLIELLVLLLPQSLRSQLSFATRVFAPSKNLRVVFDDYTTNHMVFDWEKNKIVSRISSPAIRCSYAEEIVALVYEQELLEALKSRGDAAQTVQKLRDQGGPALAVEIFRSMSARVANLKLGSIGDTRTISTIWDEETGELLDAWRLAIGRDTLRARLRHLARGKPSDRPTWKRTMIEVFRSLAVSHEGPVHKKDRDTFIKQLNQADDAHRSVFFDPQSGFLGGVHDLSPYLPIVEEFLADEATVPSVKDKFIGGTVIACRNENESRQLLQILLKTNNWNESNLKVVLDSPSSANLPDVVKLILEDVLERTSVQEVPTGRQVAEAFSVMEQDEDFLFEVMAMALAHNRLGFFDDESLELIVGQLSKSKRKELLFKFEHELLKHKVILGERQRETDTWMMVVRLFKKQKRSCAGDSLTVHAVAACIAWQTPLNQVIKDTVQECAKSKQASGFVTSILDLPIIGTHEEPALLFGNLVDLLEILDKTQESSVLLLRRTTALAGQIEVDSVGYSVLSRLVVICAQMPTASIENDYSWIPGAFRAAYNNEVADLSPLIDAMAQWVSSCWERSPEEGSLLLSSLRDDKRLEPTDQVEIFQRLLGEFKEPHLLGEIRRYLSEACAERAAGLIAESARVVNEADEDLTQYLKRHSQSDNSPEKIMERLNDPISDILSEIEPDHFCKRVSELSTKAQSQSVAYFGLLWMEKWLGKSPSLADHRGELMAHWANMLPVSPLHSYLEQLWKGCREDESRRRRMGQYLEEYSICIAQMSADRQGQQIIETIWWLIGYLENVGQKEVESLTKYIKIQPTLSTHKITFYFANKNGGLPPDGDDLKNGYEVDIGGISHKNREGKFNIFFLTRILNFAVNENKTAFLDQIALPWLADLLIYLQQNQSELNEKHGWFEDDLQDFRNACVRVLETKSKLEALTQASPEETLAVGQLAVVLEHTKAWAKITTVFMTSSNGDGISNDRTLNLLTHLLENPSSDKEKYLQALIEELNHNGDVQLQSEIYLWLMKEKFHQEWTHPLSKEVLRLLAQDLPRAKCPLECLKELIAQVGADNPAQTKLVKQHAYAIVLSYLRDSDMDEHQDQESLLHDYNAWLREEPDKDLLIGLADGVVDPVTRVFAYEDLWKKRKSTGPEQSKFTRVWGAATHVVNSAKKSFAPDTHGSAGQDVDVSSELALRKEKEFENELVIRWKSAADDAYVTTGPVTPETMGKYQKTYLTAVKHSELREVAEKMYPFLLYYEWQEYFKTDNEEKKLSHLDSIVKQIKDYPKRSFAVRKGDDRWELHIEKALRSAMPSDMTILQLYDTLQQNFPGKQDKATGLLIRQVRREAALEMMRKYPVLSIPNKTIVQQLDGKDCIYIRDCLQRSNERQKILEKIQNDVYLRSKIRDVLYYY